MKKHCSARAICEICHKNSVKSTLLLNEQCHCFHENILKFQVRVKVSLVCWQLQCARKVLLFLHCVILIELTIPSLNL